MPRIPAGVSIRVMAAATLLALALGAAPAARAARVLPITSGAAAAAATGSEAALTNPALLELTPTRQVLLAGAQVGAQNDAFTWSDYNRYNGSDLTEADKERILGLINSGGLRAGAEAGVGALAATFGRWSVGTSSAALGEATVARDMARLALFGNIENETFRLDGTTGRGAAWSALQAGYALPLGQTASGWRVAGGFTAKYVRGWASAEVLNATGQLTTTIDAIEGGGEILLRTARGGSGYSCDLGVAARRGQRVTLSLALTDALSRIGWNDEPELRHATLTANDVLLADADEVDDVVIDSTWTEPTGAYSSHLPRRLQLGAAFPLGRLQGSASLGTRFGGGFHTVTRGAVGLLWPLNRTLTLGGGLAVGSAGSSAASTGVMLNVGPVQLDLSVAARGTPLFWRARGVGVGLGLGFGY